MYMDLTTGNNDISAGVVENIQLTYTDDKISETQSLSASDSISLAIHSEEECDALKQIQYKTMIQNGVQTSMKHDGEAEVRSLDNLEKFLEDSTQTSKTERWNRLDLTMKLQKVKDFILRYKEDTNQTQEEADALFVYLKDCLDKKKLMRVKDVVYDNEEDKLMSIPGLQYNKMSKKYTIKNTDSKKGSVLSRLPQKKAKTLKKEKGGSGGK
jgi:hypothetical protein